MLTSVLMVLGSQVFLMILTTRVWLTWAQKGALRFPGPRLPGKLRRIRSGWIPAVLLMATFCCSLLTGALWVLFEVRQRGWP